MMSENLVNRLEVQKRAIEEILAVSGSPGLSIGVFHNGKIIYTKHFGRRNIQYPDPPNDHTIYYVASLYKILTVAAIAKLVHDGVLGWDVPVREYLPGFQERKDDTGLKATLRDLASHRSGLSSGVFYWGQQNGEALLPKSEIVRLACYVEAVQPFRSAFIYSQWNYALIQLIIEKYTAKPFSQFLKETILEPLQTTHTTFSTPEGTNAMTPYAVRSDGTPCKISVNDLLDEGGLAAAAGGKTSMKDILSIYIALLSAYKHQKENNVDTTPGSPFVQLRTIFEPHIALGKSKLNEQAYCLGLYRSQLPANLSIASLNFQVLRKKTPRFETKSNEVVYHHTCHTPGFFGSQFLVPSTQSGVVVLTNSTPLVDPTDFSAQLLLSVLFQEASPPNQLQLAKTVTKTLGSAYDQLSAFLEGSKSDTPPSHPLTSYAGDYWNEAGNFVLKVSAIEGGLHLKTQGKPNTTYDLQPYNEDTFYWPVDKDVEICDRGGFPFIWPGWHLLTFNLDDGGEVESLTWHHDQLGSAETFTKRLDAPGSKL